MAHPVRRNIAHLSVADRTKYIDAVVAADQRFWSGGPVSYWDFQDLAHQTTHVHGGPKFLLWHRELCNRWEALLQEVDPDVALHYWDWTTDPRSSPDGQGGTTDLSDNNFMGTMNGNVAGKLQPLHNNGVFNGSRQQTGVPQDPPQTLLRSLPPEPARRRPTRRFCPPATVFRRRSSGPSSGKLGRRAGSAHVYIGSGNIGIDGPQGFRGSVRVPVAQQRGPAVRDVANPGRAGMAARPRPGLRRPATTTDDRGITDLQPWDGTVNSAPRSNRGSGPHRRSKSRTAGTPPSCCHPATTPCR